MKARFWRFWILGGMVIPFTAALLFVSAGRMDYWQGWLFSGVVGVLSLINVLFFSRKPDLAQERLKPGRGVKGWDIAFYGIYVPLCFSIFILGALDAGRLKWTGPLPAWAYLLTYLVFFLAVALFYWAMWVNRFFSSVVRIQNERGHTVVSRGPYGFVRHPGYVGGIFMCLCFPVALGSLWTLIPAGLVSSLLVVRTCLEDNTLKRELPGYREYVEEVRYRLIPGLW